MLARRYDIGLNIDAEEADRLELSLDLLERLCFEPELAGWNGIGFVIQAYQKRCPFVIDWLDRPRPPHAAAGSWSGWSRAPTGTARSSAPRSTARPAIRSTPARSTPTSPTSPARKKLLAAPDAIYPQFATHNAHTLAAVHALAGPDY